MAKKNRKRNRMLAQAVATARATDEQTLPPPPATIPDVELGEARAQSTVTVSEQEAQLRARESEALALRSQLSDAQQAMAAQLQQLNLEREEFDAYRTEEEGRLAEAGLAEPKSSGSPVGLLAIGAALLFGRG